MDESIRTLIRRHREKGGICYVGGPVSACPKLVLGEGEETILPSSKAGRPAIVRASHTGRALK